MRYTLLEMTQSILRSIKGEAVNSITDTQESLDVADIVKEVYYSLISQTDFPEVKTFISLEASGSVNRPVKMTIPEDVYSIEWLKYNTVEDGDTEDVWREITFLGPKEFFAYTAMFSEDTDEVDTMNIVLGPDTIVFKFYNERPPQYYTTIDDTTILFDAYDSAVDATLQKSKTIAYGIRMDSWENIDGYIPRLDAHQYPILLKEAKVLAWQELKSIDNGIAQRQARDLRVAAEQKKSRANQKDLGYYYTRYPNYGRK